MGRVCSVCTAADRKAIDGELLAGQTLTAISARRAVSRPALAPLSRDAEAQREGWHVRPSLRSVAPRLATAWPVACGCRPDAPRRRRVPQAPAPRETGGRITLWG